MNYVGMFYIIFCVKFEFGVCGDFWLIEEKVIWFYVVEDYFDFFNECDMKVIVLFFWCIFWEKVIVFYVEVYCFISLLIL